MLYETAVGTARRRAIKFFIFILFLADLCTRQKYFQSGKEKKQEFASVGELFVAFFQLRILLLHLRGGDYLLLSSTQGFVNYI